MEGQAFGAAPTPAEVGAPVDQQGQQCAKCGYPLRAGVAKCPNCQTPAGASPLYRPISGTVQCGSAAPIGGTVNPYLNAVQSIPTFSLEPVARENERHAPQAVEYEGEETVLNRSNTDPTNPTITSARQAVVTCEGGAWYVQDQSALKTTFVSASEKRPLHEGDVILMGNRMFIFHEK